MSLLRPARTWAGGSRGDREIWSLPLSCRRRSEGRELHPPPEPPAALACQPARVLTGRGSTGQRGRVPCSLVQVEVARPLPRLQFAKVSVPSPPLPSSARAVLAQRARSLRLACWCRSRTRRPTRGPVIRFSATGRLQPIEAPPGTAGRLPFTPKLNGSAQPRGWTVTPCAPRERKLM